MFPLYCECPLCFDERGGELFVVSTDFDAMNWEGSMRIVCTVCKTKFTTGLIHLETEEEFNRETEVLVKELPIQRN